jgi:hypothetical protein
VVVATGPSLTNAAAKACNGWPTIAVNDAYRLLPEADVLYSGDRHWWRYHGSVPSFRGERWAGDSVASMADELGLNIVPVVDEPGFSFQPGVLHSGGNSGFQAVNLAIQFGATKIVLIGFDMHGGHFFGDHAFRGTGVRSPFEQFIWCFEHAAAGLPEHITVVNCTPGSALKCFRHSELDLELAA